VFCKNNTIVYQNADDVDNLTLSDVIKGIGCIARDSVQNTGTDVIFLSKTGIRALSRTIQEKSLPLRELSLNIRDDLVTWIDGENMSAIKSVYYERDAFYLMTLPILKQIVCLDMRTPSANGGAKVTVWDTVQHKAFCTTETRELLVGQVNGIGKYTGYSDNATAYRFRYFTNYFDLGSPTNLKLLKRVGVTVIGGEGQSFVLKWGFDYSTNLLAHTKTIPNTGTAAEYGVGEYNIGEYSGGTQAKGISINGCGSGKVIQLGFEADINGNPFSVQKIDIAVVLGKTIL
jgi:hypothetical protein